MLLWFVGCRSVVGVLLQCCCNVVAVLLECCWIVVVCGVAGRTLLAALQLVVVEVE
mgnify:CR=1 FL=1